MTVCRHTSIPFRFNPKKLYFMRSSRKYVIPALIFLPLFLWQCETPVRNAGGDTLFVSLPPEQTGIDFINVLIPDSLFNLLDFEYLYNGGGVGLANLNGDSLPDLVFTGNRVPTRLYVNRGNMKFEDITERSGVNTGGIWCTGVSVADINSDGLDDIYICTGGPGKKSRFPNLLYLNQGDLSFRESAAAYGLADSSESNQAVFFDYDKDGDLDMYLLNGGGFEKSAVTVRPQMMDGRSRNTDKLYRNDFDTNAGHPVFTDVSREAGILCEGFGLGIAMLDVNGDSWPDIYVSNDYLSKDLLYENQGDGTFRESSEKYFTHTSHFSMGNDVADLNNDGWPELLTLDMLPEDHYRRQTMFGPSQYDKFYLAVQYGYGYQYMRNMLQVGRGKGLFSEMGQIAGLDRTDWSWAPLMADFDNDGLQDIYITNGYGKNITDLDYVNYRESAMTPFAKPEEVRKQLLESVEELPEIKLPNYFFLNKGNLQFENAGTSLGFTAPSISHGAAYGDLDLDGDLDLVVNNLNMPAFVYQNTLKDKNPDSGHFLEVKLQGETPNAAGVGAKLVLYAGSGRQLRVQQPARGYQSSVSTLVHFGLGNNTSIDSLLVYWPDGKKSKMGAVPADTLLTLAQSDALPEKMVIAGTETLLHPTVMIDFLQEEAIPGNDFKVQPLLMHSFTAQGPALAVGDLNGDGLEDLVTGGSYGADAALYLQQADRTFSRRVLPTSDYEDLGILVLDVDKDGDEDLFFASGGSERYENHPLYQDRLLHNDGLGNFEGDPAALPEMNTSTAALAAADFNGDGYPDLFVGGRVNPGRFPETPRSYLLQNTGGKFKDVTAELCPELAAAGMVTSALWMDVNGDALPDLWVVGEFMPVRLFLNEGSRFREITGEAGLANSSGLWNSITPADLDNDGDLDFVLGNIGRNTWFEVDPNHPLQLAYADFDGNGSVDPLFSVFEEGDYYPLASLDVMARQLPAIRKEFLKYDKYARARTKDILAVFPSVKVQTLDCHIPASVVLENLGDLTFRMHELPMLAQIAPVKGVLTEDINFDGRIDLILVGNEYHTEVVQGIQAASKGLVLLNEGNFGFSSLEPDISGLKTSGDTRSLVKLALGSDQLLILSGVNAGFLDNYVLDPGSKGQLLTFGKEAQSAELVLGDGSRQKWILSPGGGYLSQQSRSFLASALATEVRWYDAGGKLINTQKLQAK